MFMPRIKLSWPDYFLSRVSEHFKPLRTPSRNTSYGKKNGEYIRRELHALIYKSCIEIYIWVKTSLYKILIFQSDTLYFKCKLKKRIHTCYFKNLISKFLYYSSSRVIRLIYPVAKSHQHSFFCFHFFYKFRHFIL